MFVLNFVFLALLAPSTGQSGIPQDIQGQWIMSNEDLQYKDTRGLPVEKKIWPESPMEDVFELVTVGKQNVLITSEPYVLKEQGDSDKGEESAVWKIILVAAILLVTLVGSVSMAYYLCIWRGGRIHYQPQKEGYA